MSDGERAVEKLSEDGAMIAEHEANIAMCIGAAAFFGFTGYGWGERNTWTLCIVCIMYVYG